MTTTDAMIEIRAVIRPARLDPLRAALRQIPEFPGMSVIKIDGCSALWVEQSEPGGIKRDLLDYTPKAMVTIVAPESAVEVLIATIHRIAHTGRMGDGLIWTCRVENFIRITTPA
ncbi:P-II family nitrogen regulator [Novosphingobium nitrogenifigens]|nr:P-II family nitrogen regulator [Novosphingobium nitrogenifigens]